MSGFSYPIALTPAKSTSGFYVTSRDVPELLTHGNDIPQALLSARDALAMIFFVYNAEHRPIPAPSQPQEGEWLVSPL